jgi:hypothetical protein
MPGSIYRVIGKVSNKIIKMIYTIFIVHSPYGVYIHCPKKPNTHFQPEGKLNSEAITSKVCPVLGSAN